MKLIYYALLFNLFVIFLFSLIYYVLPEGNIIENGTNDRAQPHYIDCFTLSTTIQAGVGSTNLTANTHLAKIIMCFQQMFLISSNALILYLFIKHHSKKHKST